MRYDAKLLQALAELAPAPLRRTVYRHMFANFPPDRENTAGARWNPPQVPAIYASLSRDGVLAEAEYQIGLEPLRPSAKRTVYKIEVVLSSVLDLSTTKGLRRFGVKAENLVDLHHTACQLIGGAVEHLGHDGLLIPSARHSASSNLVIYPNRQTNDYSFRVVGEEVIFDPEA